MQDNFLSCRRTACTIMFQHTPILPHSHLAGCDNHFQKHQKNYLRLGKHLLLVEDKAWCAKKPWYDVSQDGISAVQTAGAACRRNGQRGIKTLEKRG